MSTHADVVDHHSEEMTKEEHLALSLAATMFIAGAGGMLMFLLISLMLQVGY